ncbi:MAG: ABC transporter permease [Thermodesulfobacteriota bacterium]|nr:ABC transporter permease [Thermodesulfobacteriota bacterium]
MKKFANELWENRHALGSQFYVNTRTTVATTKLGMLWWILDPLFLMLIYYFLINVIFHKSIENFHLFLLCGLVTYQFFSRSLTLCTSALTISEGLIKQASLPMVLYLVVSPLVQAFFCIIGFAVVMVWNYTALGVHTLAVIFPVFVTILITITAGLFLSIFEVYIRDTGKLITYLLRFGMFLSPVLYSADRIYDNPAIPQYAKTLYSLNPMVHVVVAVQDLLFYGRMFDPVPLLVVFLVVLMVMQLGLLFFRKASPYVPKML